MDRRAKGVSVTLKAKGSVVADLDKSPIEFYRVAMKRIGNYPHPWLWVVEEGGEDEMLLSEKREEAFDFMNIQSVYGLISRQIDHFEANVFRLRRSEVKFDTYYCSAKGCIRVIAIDGTGNTAVDLNGWKVDGSPLCPGHNQ